MTETGKNNFQSLQDRIVSWSNETLKNPPLEGTVRHLAEEVRDLEKNPYDPLALADVFILLMGICSKVGFSMDDMLVAIESKQLINESRIWGEADAEGIIRHCGETRF